MNGNSTNVGRDEANKGSILVLVPLLDPEKGIRYNGRGNRKEFPNGGKEVVTIKLNGKDYNKELQQPNGKDYNEKLQQPERGKS